MTTETLPATTQENDGARKLTLLKAIGLDRVSPEQRELALNLAQRYELDLLMKHMVLIDGRPYITRDGLLHVAHRSGQLDGIETTPAELSDGFWRSTASVYRKDMSRPFTYAGRYPEQGRNKAYGPEMAVKVAEVMALRRAFDVAAPTAEEKWDADVPAEPVTPAPSLAERAAAARAAIVVEPNETAAQEASAEPSVETEEAEDTPMSAESEAPAKAVGSRPAANAATCGLESPYGDGAACGLPTGHKGLHRQLEADGKVVGSWPDR